MSEPETKNPFEPFFEEIRRIVKEEIQAVGERNGHPTSAPPLITAEDLAKALKVNKATVYGWVKTKSIPCYQAGKFVRFNLAEVLESQRKREKDPA